MQYASLGELGVMVLDCEHRTPSPAPAGHPYVAIPDIQQGRVVLETTRRITDEDLLDWTRRTKPRAGDILVTRRGRVGDTAPIPTDDCAIGQNLIILRSDGTVIDQSFLRWATRGPAWQSEVDRLINVGAVFSSLNVGDIGKMRIPVLPLPEQQAIAEVLGALDDKIAANRALVATSLELVGAHHRHIKSGGVCTRTAFTDVAEIGGGATPSTKVDAYWEGDIPWAAPSDITALPAPYLEDTPRKITKAGLTACSSPLHPVGSILMTSRATIGAFAIAQVPTAVNQGFIVVQPHDPTLRWWLLAEMQQRVPEFVAMANGATFLELPRKAFRKMSFALPENAALQHFDSLAGPLHATSSSALRESSTLAALRDTLLPALMDGTLRVKDAEKTVSEAL